MKKKLITPTDIQTHFDFYFVWFVVVVVAIFFFQTPFRQFHTVSFAIGSVEVHPDVLVYRIVQFNRCVLVSISQLVPQLKPSFVIRSTLTRLFFRSIMPHRVVSSCYWEWSNGIIIFSFSLMDARFFLFLAGIC